MSQFDLPLETLVDYRPDRHEPADFDAFWDETIGEARGFPLDARFVEVDAGYRHLVTEDVTFNGFGGHPIKGWMLRPRGVDGPLPTVVTFIGYGGGRGLLGEWTALPSAGFAQLVMDVRGQGAGHRISDTADPGVGGPHSGGFLTMGIEDPRRYYYRRLFTDAVRAIEAAHAHPSVDPARVVISGGSQGGAITLAAAALTARHLDAVPAAAIVDVPFLSHVRRAIRITDASPYAELVRFFKVRRTPEEQVFATLDYFDGVNFAARAPMPASFSVALMDDVCPPSTVYAAYNHYAGDRRITVYPFNGHEGGEKLRDAEHLAFALEVL
jgi:cephalosporin-C deacetylase